MIDLRQMLRLIYWKLEKLIDPGVVNTELIYAEVVRSWMDSDSIWLDVGCGHSVFASWLPPPENLVEKCKLVVGIDYDFEGLQKHPLIRNRVRGDFLQAPYREKSFNRITANMVMEHVPDPVGAFQSIERLLKPNGVFIFHTPNYWHYWTLLSSLIPQTPKNKLVEIADKRKEDDVFPTFYKANSVSSIMQAAKDAGLRVRELHKLSTSSTGTIMMLGPFVIFDLLLRRLTRWKRLENFRANFVVVLEKPGREETVVAETAGSHTAMDSLTAVH